MSIEISSLNNCNTQKGSIINLKLLIASTVIAIVVMVGIALIVSEASATPRSTNVRAKASHYLSTNYVATKIQGSKYDGWCGKGAKRFCAYRGLPNVWGTFAPHGHLFQGYYQEWRYVGKFWPTVPGVPRLYECTVAGTVIHSHSILMVYRKCGKV